MVDGWSPEAAEKALRRRPLRVLARPWTERAFVLSEYEALLRELADAERFRVVPLREFATAPRDRVLIGLRHDIEERFASALEMAEVEHLHALRATYFVLHTAPYYRRSLLPGLRSLQDMGHEVGWHNDLVTLQCVHGVEPRRYLANELEWLRGEGIDVRGSSSHGSYWTQRLGYHNQYFFEDLEEVHADRPNRETVTVNGRAVVISKGTQAEFGLEYEAYHLGEDRYFSDARFDSEGRRWHPRLLDLDALAPGDSAIILVHPDYWDPSVPRKAVRTLTWAGRRLFKGERAWRARGGSG